jgi:hypothetical protein
LHETKSSDEGQILEALRGRSPLHETKSSDEGQLIAIITIVCRERPHRQ